MPISKPYPEHNGFTLIEMLVVLSIISLAAVLFISSTNGGNGIEKRKAVQNLEKDVLETRRQAIDRSIAQAVELEGADIDFEAHIGNDKNLIFYADGSTNGGAYKDDGRTILTIRWIDGASVK